MGLTDASRRLLKGIIPLKRAIRKIRASTYAYPRWSRLLASDAALWKKALGGADRARPVLIATTTGGFLAGAGLESMLAVALTLRSKAVDVLLCDHALPACLLSETSWFPDARRFAARGPRDLLCDDCFRPALRLFESVGVRIRRLSSLVTVEEAARARALSREVPVSDIRPFRFGGLAVGEHAVAGALRFFAVGDLGRESAGEGVLRRYLEASIVTAHAVLRLLEGTRYESAVFHHGIYVPQGVIGEACRRQGVRVINWAQAYRSRCFIFSHGDTYHRTMMNEPASDWESQPWTPERKKTIEDYLRSRSRGESDWIRFNSAPRENLQEIIRTLELDPGRPSIGLLTNVVWDAQIHYPSKIFRHLIDWLGSTIDHFAARPGLQLVIRVHPAEVTGILPSRQRVADELRRRGPLPANCSLVDADSPISTYALMSLCNAAIIYGTKTGVELAAAGMPVIVAGEAWIRGKGLTFDPATRQEYFDLLGRLPFDRKPSPDTVERAQKYAYHFFFRRMIPFDFVRERRGNPPYGFAIRSLKALLPGASPGLDAVCDGILKGSPFILDGMPCPPDQEPGRMSTV